MLGRRKKAQTRLMAGYRLLTDDREAILTFLSESYMAEDVEERNDYANALLALGESLGIEEFVTWRRMICDLEWAIGARRWEATLPTDNDTELNITKQQALLHSFVKSEIDPKADGTTFLNQLGPDLPAVIDGMCSALIQQRLSGSA